MKKAREPRSSEWWKEQCELRGVDYNQLITTPNREPSANEQGQFEGEATLKPRPRKTRKDSHRDDKPPQCQIAIDPGLHVLQPGTPRPRIIAIEHFTGRESAILDQECQRIFREHGEKLSGSELRTNLLNETFTPGELASIAGVDQETIKHYADSGLIRASVRDSKATGIHHKHRRYSFTDAANACVVAASKPSKIIEAQAMIAPRSLRAVVIERAIVVISKRKRDR